MSDWDTEGKCAFAPGSLPVCLDVMKGDRCTQSCLLSAGIRLANNICRELVLVGIGTCYLVLRGSRTHSGVCIRT